MQADAQALRLNGTVQTYERGGVRIHTYISPEDGLLTNTPIIEGPDSLIIFDGQFFLPHAREAGAYAATLDKPVERIILSHIHLDHWSGLGILADQFPGAPVCSLGGVVDYLRKHAQGILDARRTAFGERIPLHPTIPGVVMAEGRTTIGGVKFEFMRFVDAESAVQLVAIMPDQGVMLAFDLAFAPYEHVFTVTPHFGNWVRILDLLEASSFDVVVSGHGSITDRSALHATADYLRTGAEIYARAKGPAEYAERMKTTFPDRSHQGWIDLSASLLYSVIDAYDTSN